MLQSANPTRDRLLVYINGERHEVAGADAFLTLSDFLRLRLGQVGTKIVCSEGDCGACSVLIGRPPGDTPEDAPASGGGVEPTKLVYRAIDSCIQFMYQLDRSHVVSIEGLKRNGLLSPVQDAMVKCHGSQCGFCTPGFVMTMAGLLEDEGTQRKETLTPDEFRYGLTGNLCRCTGYVQIIDAGCSVDPGKTARVSELYPDGPMVDAFTSHALENVAVVAEDGRTVALPGNLKEAIAFKAAHPGCTVVAGATDIGVQHNKGKINPQVILCLANVGEMKGISGEEDTLTVGAGTTWTEVQRHIKDRVPQFHEVLSVFGSPQIRNAGTIGGNIANASPIADSVPFLFVMGAELEIAGPGGTRRVGINDFYQGYKQFDLGADELIARVHIPLPSEAQTLRLYKVSRRRDLDISTFTAAILMELDDAGETIRDVRIAYGGVAAVVMRLPKAEAFLAGRPFEEGVLREAGRVAGTEITPITDVRGGADFRLQLAENILAKFYFDCAQKTPV
jgi:xanthine dehydrogenase small subunit